jgi:3-hydroxymyristoyl/3-hydroxydecanoyl-(acyl carrier protein) dehydratase
MPISQTANLTARAHESFLKLSERFAAFQTRNVQEQIRLSGGSTETVKSQVFMDRAACLEFAVGKIGNVLGTSFSHVDDFPSRVRLPDEPLMLVDRIVSVTGKPHSMKAGSCVTEHDVKAGSWYLDAGRIPTCIAVEAGQADLFLSAYLGIDSQTRGQSVYRLLDAIVTFENRLPVPGEAIRYDIAIDGFGQHENTWLFFFRFDATVNGRPFMSMRKGCAGFFTQQELARGRGIVLTAGESAQRPGKKPADWKKLAPFDQRLSLSDKELAALRQGDLAGAFGSDFAAIPVRSPLTLPPGKMRLVDRILSLDPSGGRYGMGLAIGEADIRPDDWHLVCHFKGDNVMPGTLMYECCLHTLRVYLMRMGWIGENGETNYEPVPGVGSQLKCRGQVLPETKKVRYELHIKELGYRPEPYCLADAFMYSDDKNIVQITDMSVRLSGATRAQMESLWPVPGLRVSLYGPEKILAFSNGKPSEAFGDRYKPFDEDRVIARLPGPPYQFLDRIIETKGEPWVLKAGAQATAQYDVPPQEWYFQENGQATMPFGVLLEVALQPCGWLAAYCGSALTSPVDLSFRNLGGEATQFIEVTPQTGTLTTRVTMTKVSQSGGMIIQNYDLEMQDQLGRLVYQGKTEFGFFTKDSLAQQVGLRGATPFVSPVGVTPRSLHLVGGYPRLPGPKLLLLDQVDLFEGLGPKNLGVLVGHRAVNPQEWFFSAHFYQDPVCPGSLGLESFIELMKCFARDRWPTTSPEARFQNMILGQNHRWLYRGQYTPANKKVEVQCWLTVVDDESKSITAEGYLIRDGLVVYQMKEFTLKVIP